MRALNSFPLSSALVALACAVPLSALAEPVNINTADARTIAKELKGIGVARAQAIVAYRNQHGPFKSPDELGLVKGIAQKVIDENRANIRVDTARSTNSAAKQEAPKSAAAKPVTAPERMP